MYADLIIVANMSMILLRETPSIVLVI